MTKSSGRWVGGESGLSRFRRLTTVCKDRRMARPEKTYEMVANPPPPMAWGVYEDEARTLWKQLLDSHPSESAVQKFLEQHPSFLPGHSPIFGSVGHHGPFVPAVISQPPLQGIGKKIPDFMWITRDFLYLSPVLIEIEAPTKKWLTAKGHPTQAFVQARNQLFEWGRWFERPENQAVFLAHYRVPPVAATYRSRTFRPSLVLIFGRRFENEELIARVRHELDDDRTLLITFDHLKPDRRAQDYMCVTKNGDDYIARAIPPVVRLGPRYASGLSIVRGKKEALDHSTPMTPERRAFLEERFAYWDDWGGREEDVMFLPDDVE
jgi:hypothetical protein